MTRAEELRKLIATYGTTVTGYYTDGPNSGFWGRDDPSKRNHVMVTIDTAEKFTRAAETELMMLFWFDQNVDRAYFTKKSHRLKIIFNCRSERGKKIWSAY